MTKAKSITIEDVKIVPKEQSKSKVTKSKTTQVKSFKVTKFLVAIFISLLVAVGLLSALAFAYAKVYENQFYPGVKVANIELSGKNKGEAQKLVGNKIANIDQTKLNIKNGEVKEVKLADLNLGVSIDETLNKAFDYGREANSWQNAINQFKSLYQDKNFNYALSGDEEKVNAKLKELAPDLDKEAKNATILVKDDKLNVQKEEQGKKIDIEQFKDNLSKVLSSGSKETIVLTWKIIEPSIKEYQVEAILPQVEKIISEKINFTDTEKNKSYIANKEEIASWLVLKAQPSLELNIEISDDAIKNYIQEQLAKNVNKKMIDKKINAKTKAVISEGQDGRALDEGKTLESIKQILTSRLDNQTGENNINLVISVQEKGEKEIEPQEAYAGGGTPGLAEGKYIELNLSTQTLYLFTSETQEGAFSVSTGKWSMPTPIGTRYIQEKSDRAWSEKYGLYMPYWNGIGGGYGIHELPEWPGGAKEGESHLGTPVSHGCIRLGVGAAAYVYGWAPIGTPVFIHK